MIPAVANAVLVMGGLALVMALAIRGLGTLARRRPRGDDLADSVNALLPQIQCAQCGYPGCRPYAAAIAEGAALDLCPPGGTQTAQAIAQLLGRDTTGLEVSSAADQVARIVEKDCIGCGLCLPACPVDAIVGAPKYMHTVLDSHCTGCELCLPPCPVDCIELVACQPEN